VDRTGERDAREMRAGWEADAPTRELRVSRQSAATPGESGAAAPLARDVAGQQMAVGDIPAQLPGFQPRPGLMAQLNRAGPEAPVVQVLTGRSGVGRTQLAAAYARAKLMAAWRLVAWVNAETPGRLLAGLAAVADATGLSDGGSGHGMADAGLVVRDWLETDGARCLLIFDDAEDPDVLRPFIPVRGAARVLITTARESVADLGTTIPVDVFSAEEALALLDGRTGLADEAGASALAAELGYLPLAVDQAATVIARQYRGYGAYLRRLQALPLGDYLSGDEDPYPPGVAETVLLSLEVARGADQAGVGNGVLEMAAVLSAAGVGRDLLRVAGEAGALATDGRPVPAVAVDQALARLADQALLTFTVDGQTVIMHRLVAWVIRDELARRERLTTVCRAAASVLEARAETMATSEDRRTGREFPEQVTALLDTAGQADEPLTTVLLRLRLVALDYLIELGDSMPQAIVFGERLISSLERVLGPDHPDTMNARNGLAAAYHAAGRTADAIPLVQQALAARERLLGADHPSTLASRNNLASAYRAAGRPAEAIPLFETNVAACERLLGADHPKTLASRHNLDLAREEAEQAENADHGPDAGPQEHELVDQVGGDLQDDGP
jgi:tetratricopeptide (TPR) repeat protein